MSMAQFWFNFNNAWSGQKYYTEGAIQLFNLLYTSVPILLLGTYVIHTFIFIFVRSLMWLCFAQIKCIICLLPSSLISSSSSPFFSLVPYIFSFPPFFKVCMIWMSHQLPCSVILSCTEHASITNFSWYVFAGVPKSVSICTSYSHVLHLPGGHRDYPYFLFTNFIAAHKYDSNALSDIFL